VTAPSKETAWVDLADDQAATTEPGLSPRAVEKNKRELRAKVIERAVKMVDIGDLGRGSRTLGSP
jgi:hypothetical protein